MLGIGQQAGEILADYLGGGEAHGSPVAGQALTGDVRDHVLPDSGGQPTSPSRAHRVQGCRFSLHLPSRSRHLHLFYSALHAGILHKIFYGGQPPGAWERRALVGGHEWHSKFILSMERATLQSPALLALVLRGRKTDPIS